MNDPGSTPLKVTFVGHDASRTGAPRILLSLLRWLLREKAPIRPKVVLLGGGDLVGEFEAVAPTLRFPTAYGRYWRTIAPRLHASPAEGVMSALARRRLAREVTDADLIYINSAAALWTVAACPDPLPPIIAHLHELPPTFDRLITPYLLRKMKARIAHYVAPSEGVVAMLFRHGISREQVTHVPEFIETNEVVRMAEAARGASPLPGAPGRVWVCGSGVASARKGTDLFVEVARRLSTTHPHIRFAWVGKLPRGSFGQSLESDSKNINPPIVWCGSLENPHSTVGAGDVFVLPSREDPFPLVVLEAAALGKPVVCFSDAGGAPDFVRNDAGHVVPYGDIDRMASAVIDLATDADKRTRMGVVASARIRERYDVSVQGPRLEALMARIARSGLA